MEIRSFDCGHPPFGLLRFFSGEGYRGNASFQNAGRDCTPGSERSLGKCLQSENHGQRTLEDQVRSLQPVRDRGSLPTNRYFHEFDFACTPSKPFSNWVTSGVSASCRPSRPIARHRY